MGCGSSLQTISPGVSPGEEAVSEQKKGASFTLEKMHNSETNAEEKINSETGEISYEEKSPLKEQNRNPLAGDDNSVEPEAKEVREVSDMENHEQSENSSSHGSCSFSQLDTREVIRGNVTIPCPSTARIVRIFTSSTFTDTRHERNALMERVYPALKDLCQQHGYEFQVVDMRWGIRDEATDDHMTTDLCLREVDLCKKISTGPYFVTFLSHKYGYRDCPNKIEATEFQTLYESVEDNAKDLLDIWFKRDNNAVPPTYMLQPISSVLPEFLAEDEEKRKSAKTSWYDQSAIMHEALITSARQKLDKERAHRYIMSVTEAEITRGVIEADGKMNDCLWFQRTINDIEKLEPSYLLSRYQECLGDETKVKESQVLLQDLRDRRLPRLIVPGNHKQYFVDWTENGIDPSKNRNHDVYISKLCEDFQQRVAELVTTAIKERNKTVLESPLYSEIVEHTVFCQSKCKTFHGREDTLDLVTQYLKSKSRSPFIVYGPSGCGKTSIVAMAAILAVKIYNKNAGVVIRFIGTTPDSSHINTLLASVISQIWQIYGSEEKDLPADIRELTEIFHTTLTLPSKSEPLVLLLDSLDQFDPAEGARQLSWLPKELPENVKLIVSTLPDAQYESFPTLQEMFTTQENHLKVPKLDDHDVGVILDKWLEDSKRSLTESQRKVVLDAFQKCPLPLFLKLSFDEACRWTSYTPQSQTTLQTSVRSSINALFCRIEGLHGKILVSKSLAYLTLSKKGLTESELEDILSCDDDVLNDVFMYWTPPVRRLPPLLLVRLKADLGQYLVDRGADGVRVFFWYHRQFIEAAAERYCSVQGNNEKMHAALGDFFAGVWANGNAKPYADKKGSSYTADRKVASQPIKFKTSYNLRKLSNLPHHRTKSRQLELLKQECLINFNFLQGKLNASGLRSVLDDFMAAREIYPDDDQLKAVEECLQLSQNALLTYPKELPSQLLGRIRNKQELKELLEDCMKAQEYFLLPNKPVLTYPGGHLIHCLADHKDDLNGIDMTSDSKLAVTSSEDRSVKVWDIFNGRLIRSIDNIGFRPQKVLLCDDNSVFVVHAAHCISAYNINTGRKLYKIQFEEQERPFCIGGKRKNILCTFAPTSAVLYEANTGTLIREVSCGLLNEGQIFSHFGPCAGSVQYAAVLDYDKFNIIVFDLENKTFLHKKEIYPKFIDEYGDENQHQIDAFVFSQSGEYLYISNIITNNVSVYKTKTMTEEKVYVGEHEDCCFNFRLTNDGKTLYFTNTIESKVFEWNLETGQKSTILTETLGITGAIMNDHQTVVTLSKDKVVRIWDLTRAVKEEEDEDEDEENEEEMEDSEEEEFYAHPSDDSDADKRDLKQNMGIFPREKRKKSNIRPLQIQDLQPLSNPRYIILRVSRPLEHYIKIHDLVLDKVVKQFRLVYSAIAEMKPLSDSKHILTTLGDKVKKINLISGEVLSFQGNVNTFANILPVRDETEVVTQSRGKRRLKIYSMVTGKVLSILKTDNDKKYEAIKTNDKGTVVVAGTEEGPCYMFDVVSRTCLWSVDVQTLGVERFDIKDALITNDFYLILQGNKRPAQASEDDDSAYIMFCLDIKNRRRHKELVDYEYYRKYADDKDSRTNIATNALKLLDNNTVLSNHNDSYIRVFDITSGELHKRVRGHHVCRFSTVGDGPYFLSHGVFSTDNNFRLIDKSSLKTVATFSPDSDIKGVSLTSDGHHVVGYFPEYQHPVLWSIRGGPRGSSQDNLKTLSSYPNIYGNEHVKSKLFLSNDDDDRDDPDDPDTDVESDLGSDTEESDTDSDPEHVELDPDKMSSRSRETDDSENETNEDSETPKNKI